MSSSAIDYADTKTATASSLDVSFPFVPVRSVGELLSRMFALFTGSLAAWGPLVAVAMFPFDVLVAVGDASPDLRVLSSTMTLVQNLLTPLVTGGVIFAMVEHLRDGRRPSMGEMASWGAKFYLPMLGWGIVVGLLCALGLVALIVPGVYLAIVWALVFVIVAVEGKHRHAVLGRSYELTKGRRLMLLAAYAVFVLILLVPSFAAGVAIEALVASGVPTTVPVILTALLNMVLSIMMWLTTAATVLVYLSAIEVERGACRACGYSLAGNTSGVCPECGAVVPADADLSVPAPGSFEPWNR